jgi:hypothetical protein
MEPPQVKLVHGQRASYRFICPTCGDSIVKDADKKIVGLLLTAGVDWEAEGDDGSRHPELFDLDAAPLTLDDLIDFHRELEDL